ncbi:MAG TPA: hypothetical protein VF472_17650 [Burkholderiaceae bacterium]
MLDQADAEQFSPLTGQACTMSLPDGSSLTVQIEGTWLSPKARNPHAASPRTPFTLGLVAEANEFVAGPCHLRHQDRALLENAYVSRVAPAGRDPSKAYYEVIFN